MQLSIQNPVRAEKSKLPPVVWRYQEIVAVWADFFNSYFSKSH
jgi:hypothetical protein